MNETIKLTLLFYYSINYLTKNSSFINSEVNSSIMNGIEIRKSGDFLIFWFARQGR